MKRICLLISLILLLSCSFNSKIYNSSKDVKDFYSMNCVFLFSGTSLNGRNLRLYTKNDLFIDLEKIIKNYDLIEFKSNEINGFGTTQEFIFYFQDSPFKKGLTLKDDIYDFFSRKNSESKTGCVLVNIKFEYFQNNILTKKYQEKISFLAHKNFPDKEMTIEKFERIPRELRKNFLKEFISSDCSFHRSKFIEENKKELYKEFVKIDVTEHKKEQSNQKNSRRSRKCHQLSIQ